MLRMRAYRQGLLVLTVLALGLAACTAGPAAETATATPSPAPLTEQPQPTPEPGPTEAPAGTPTEAPDDPYDYDYPAPAPATSSPSAGDATLSAADSAEHGAYLAGPEGFALYIFTNDSPGASSCTDACAEAWPPLTVAMGETPTAGEGVTGTLDTIVREDGTYQVTYNDAPLYYFAADTAAGETSGEGVGGVWFLAQP